MTRRARRGSALDWPGGQSCLEAPLTDMAGGAALRLSCRNECILDVAEHLLAHVGDFLLALI